MNTTYRTKSAQRAARLKHISTNREVVGSASDIDILTFNLPNDFSRIMAARSTQNLREMSTTNLLRDKRRPTIDAEKLTAICEEIL
jgi:hypothetical protein